MEPLVQRVIEPMLASTLTDLAAQGTVIAAMTVTDTPADQSPRPRPTKATPPGPPSPRGPPNLPAGKPRARGPFDPNASGGTAAGRMVQAPAIAGSPYLYPSSNHEQVMLGTWMATCWASRPGLRGGIQAKILWPVHGPVRPQTEHAALYLWSAGFYLDDTGRSPTAPSINDSDPLNQRPCPT